MCIRDSDEGAPLSTELLDMAFVLRLEPESADTPWHEEREAPAEPELAVSRAALNNIFRPRAEAVTEEVRGRMARLRADLAAHDVRISRRTLDAVWDFCAAAAPLLREHSPMQALDMAPVSYTHLDVYKRQGYACSSQRAKSSSPPLNTLKSIYSSSPS